MALIDWYTMLFYRPLMKIILASGSGILCPLLLTTAEGPMGTVSAGFAGAYDSALATEKCKTISSRYIDYIFYGGGIDNRGSFWSIDQMAV